MGKWLVTKKDTFAPGQLWASAEGGQRLITKIEDDRVYFDTVALPPSCSGKPRKHVGWVSLDRFSKWSSRLIQSGVHCAGTKTTEVVNHAREEIRRAS